ncbi:MAG: NADH-quinone oxidoreductase subunit NuoH [Candidatus Tectomicrobia bacterium]|nr:NADH-quinone oxidoreductase subunit NuoH [Candidatus Tectomicrobia bacterium]
MMTDLLITIVKILVVFGVYLTMVAYLSLVERRVSAFIQDRRGPNRVGPFGLLQPLADGLKFMFKEDLIPHYVNRPVYLLAPLVALVPAFITMAVIPFGNTLPLFGRDIPLVIANVNIGFLYIFALTSMGVYGVVLAGWSSNSKYSLIGGLRASAQMISYELSLGLAAVGVLIVAGSLRLPDIVAAQSGLRWNFWMQPLGFIIFLIAVFAETNRLPFDLPEAEPELVGGYHTEYSSMKFAMFFMAEYANMLTASAVVVSLYLGGWQVPYLEQAGLPPLLLSLAQVLAFVLKVGVMLFFFVWVRWTLPRFRYDQLMRLGWKITLPLAILNIFYSGYLVVAKWV